MRPGRRTFLRTVVTGWLIALLPGRALKAAASDRKASAAHWLACLPATPGARHLGASCLQQGLLEPSPETLAAKIETALGKPPRTLCAARRRLATVVGDEFARREWLRVDGWWLSRTEARLYALAALEN